MTKRVGQQLGHYRLMQLLGEGGFAEVYLGEHIHLGSQAAIKVLHSQLTSDDVDKFLMEARNLVRLIHPNIVRVLDFGIEEKTPFLVMDYAPNGTLRQLHPKRIALPLATVVSYVKQIADGLQFAHDEKLIHRDIKPENMLIGRRNEILLSDFGIAIVAQSSRYQSTQDLAGTIAYMAPEQIQTHPRPASDQYSLGIVVYEWLTGDRPFHGGFSEIAIKHTVVPPPPLREKIPNISPDVEQIVLTALAKEPKDRFGSVQAFARALEQTNQSNQKSQLAPTIVVKPPAPVFQAPPLVTPTTPPITPISQPIPPTQLVDVSKPVGTILHIYRGHTRTVKTITWSLDGQHLASGSEDSMIRVWNATNGIGTNIYGHTRSVKALMWSPDGQRLASASEDNTVRVLHPMTGEELFTYHGHRGFSVNAITWSPDSLHIASAGDDQTVQIWNASTGKCFVTYSDHSGWISSIAWSPDGLLIASGGYDTTVQVRNLTTSSKAGTYRNHMSSLQTIGWSPDSKYIVSGDSSGKIHVWDVISGSKLLTYQGHSGQINSVVWSLNGFYIASGSNDKTVQIWNATTGKTVFTYRNHSGAVNAVVWSPDGKYIASGSNDKTVQVWIAPYFE